MVLNVIRVDLRACVSFTSHASMRLDVVIVYISTERTAFHNDILKRELLVFIAAATLPVFTVC